MNKLILATSLSLALFAGAGVAQSGTDRGDRAQAHAERRAAMLTETLQLTPAQALEVESIMAEQAGAQRELHQRFRSERKALREQGDAQLAQVLSVEQQAQLEQLRAERKARWHDKRRHGRGPGGERYRD